MLPADQFYIFIYFFLNAIKIKCMCVFVCVIKPFYTLPRLIGGETFKTLICMD